jgi:Methyltransferase domain
MRPARSAFTGCWSRRESAPTRRNIAAHACPPPNSRATRRCDFRFAKFIYAPSIPAQMNLKPTMNFTCKICSNQGSHQTYDCSEKMFGWGDKFLYFQCAGCGCLQIAETPANPGRFYPADYYSFRSAAVPKTGWRSRLAARRDFSIATNRGVFGKLIGRFFPAHADLASLSSVPLRRETRILDVGCGGGELLRLLHRAGFHHVAGIDPFLSGDIEISPGVSVRKLSLDQIQDKYDLIMLHHVFEHVESGRETLELCRQRLAPCGKILLRFPTADSDA